MERKEIRSFACEYRAGENKDGSHYIVGVPIVFGMRTNLGWYDEIIERGALKNANLKDVRLLVNHDDNMIPLARSRSNIKDSTMKLEIIDGVGLRIKADLDTENNSDSRSLYSAIERGDITGMSFAFMVKSDSWDDVDSDHPTRHILEIDYVSEVSAVTWPAYPQTTINARGTNPAPAGKRNYSDEDRERDKDRIRILAMM